jgi:hypothetical protein
VADDEGGAKPQPVVLRIKLRYDDVDLFVDRFAPNIGRAGLFLHSKTPRPVGTEIKFELRMSDDKPVLVGIGVVKSIRAYDPDRPRDPSGMMIGFTRVTRDSRDLLLRILEHRRGLGLVDGPDGMPAPFDDEVAPTPPPPAPETLGDPTAVAASAAAAAAAAIAATTSMAAIAVPEPPAPVAPPSPLAPEPVRRARPRPHELIAAAGAGLSTAAVAIDEAVDVARVLARARGMVASDLDSELAALGADTPDGSAPRQVTADEASSRLAALFNTHAVAPRDRARKPKPKIAEGTDESAPMAAATPSPEPVLEPEPPRPRPASTPPSIASRAGRTTRRSRPPFPREPEPPTPPPDEPPVQVVAAAMPAFEPVAPAEAETIADPRAPDDGITAVSQPTPAAARVASEPGVAVADALDSTPPSDSIGEAVATAPEPALPPADAPPPRQRWMPRLDSDIEHAIESALTETDGDDDAEALGEDGFEILAEADEADADLIEAQPTTAELEGVIPGSIIPPESGYSSSRDDFGEDEESGPIHEVPLALQRRFLEDVRTNPGEIAGDPYAEPGDVYETLVPSEESVDDLRPPSEPQVSDPYFVRNPEPPYRPDAPYVPEPVHDSMPSDDDFAARLDLDDPDSAIALARAPSFSESDLYIDADALRRGETDGSDLYIAAPEPPIMARAHIARDSPYDLDEDPADDVAEPPPPSPAAEQVWEQSQRNRAPSRQEQWDRSEEHAAAAEAAAAAISDIEDDDQHLPSSVGDDSAVHLIEHLDSGPMSPERLRSPDVESLGRKPPRRARTDDIWARRDSDPVLPPTAEPIVPLEDAAIEHDDALEAALEHLDLDATGNRAKERPPTDDGIPIDFDDD